jgi:hypothetical protein
MLQSLLGTRFHLVSHFGRENVKGYTPSTMEVYKSETAEILRRYRAGEITRHECINRLEPTV